MVYDWRHSQQLRQRVGSYHEYREISGLKRASDGGPRRKSAAAINPLAFIHYVPLVVGMPVCTTNVRKRKARRVKNDRLQAAKAAAKAKV